MNEVNTYNQAKATIDSELSASIHKSQLEKNEINTSKKRLELIESSLPEIKLNLEKLHKERSSLESTINQMRESIQQTNDERNS